MIASVGAEAWGIDWWGGDTRLKNVSALWAGAGTRVKASIALPSGLDQLTTVARWFGVTAPSNDTSRARRRPVACTQAGTCGWLADRLRASTSTDALVTSRVVARPLRRFQSCDSTGR